MAGRKRKPTLSEITTSYYDRKALEMLKRMLPPPEPVIEYSNRAYFELYDGMAYMIQDIDRVHMNLTLYMYDFPSDWMFKDTLVPSSYVTSLNFKYAGYDYFENLHVYKEECEDDTDGEWASRFSKLCKRCEDSKKFRIPYYDDYTSFSDLPVDESVEKVAKELSRRAGYEIRKLVDYEMST